MAKQTNSIDGFVPRRPGARPSAASPEPTSRQLGQPEPIQSTRRPQLGKPALSRSDLDESLKGIDTSDNLPKKTPRRGGKPKSKLRRIIKWVLLVLVVVALGIGAWFAYKALNTSNNIFKGNILDAITQNQPLKQDANGRSNILVLGTSTDDPGHDAPFLTDSIMIISVDQKNKNAYMVSLPRDLEVEYGELCEAGSRGKINAYYHFCAGGAEENGSVDQDRAALTKTAGLVGGILDLEIQYGVNVNYTVMRELVGAVGGITVNIEGSGGAPGIMDSNFDWKCGLGDPKVSRAERLQRCPPNGHFIEYPNGPAFLDAEHALYLAQARGDSQPTYGLGRSNFDRELNQQKIVKAIREKALSAQVLTDFGKVNGILDALGNNLRTTFETKEFKTLVQLAKEIKSEEIQSISLIDGDETTPPVMNGNGQPAAGKYNYADIQAFLRRKLSSDPIIRESASIVVMNGTNVAGLGQREADKLTEAGYGISNISTAPEGTYAAVELYQITKDKPGTKGKLETRFGVKAKTTPPPVAAPEGANFIIIFGKDPEAAKAQG